MRYALVTGLLVAAFAAGCVSIRGRGQPHMVAALDHLKAARHELAGASSDKGGHRAKALALVDEAMEEVRRGIRFDRRR